MGKRKIVIRKSVVASIAKIAWFIESKGMLATAEKFSDAAYDFIETLSEDRVIHAICRDPERNSMGFSYKIFKKKYTVVFLETDNLITICELLPSKLIKW